MATAESQQTRPQNGRRIDVDKFREWCEKQIENSCSPTARIITDFNYGDGDQIRFRIREEPGESPEDIVLIRGKEVDTLRFEKGENMRQFHAHRRDFTMTDKTLTVRSHGREITRASTGTKGRRGGFPV